MQVIINLAIKPMIPKSHLAAKILVCCLSLVLSGVCEEPIPQEQEGPLIAQVPWSKSIIHNSTEAAVIVEYQAATPLYVVNQDNDQWRQISLGPDKESEIVAARLRVATTRADGAMIIVELPIVSGKKYEVIRNDTCGCWDFRRVLETSASTH